MILIKVNLLVTPEVKVVVEQLQTITHIIEYIILINLMIELHHLKQEKLKIIYYNQLIIFVDKFKYLKN